MAIKKAVKKAVTKVKSAPPKKKTASVAGKKVATKKAVAKKKAPAKKSVPAKSPTRSPNIVKPQLAKKKVVGKPFPAKLQTTTKGNSTTISVAQKEVAVNEVVVEEKRLMMPPPPRPSINKNGKKVSSLKPIKAAPAPLVMSDSENWTATELKSRRSELAKDLVRLKEELSVIEVEMDDLISASGVGAGDDLGDAGGCLPFPIGAGDQETSAAIAGGVAAGQARGIAERRSRDNRRRWCRSRSGTSLARSARPSSAPTASCSASRPPARRRSSRACRSRPRRIAGDASNSRYR